MEYCIVASTYGKRVIRPSAVRINTAKAMTDQNKIIIVLGMHRSGTSLLARWLHTSGVPMGERLLSASSSNPTGHFEDLDFLKFHTDLLSRRRLEYDVKDHFAPPLDHEVQEAMMLVDERNQQYAQWGWKDPRTCLLIDMWKQVVPNAYYVVLYRPPSEIIASILRRRRRDQANIANFFTRQWKAFGMVRRRATIYHHYLRVANHYHEQILLGMESVDPSRKLFLTIDLLRTHENAVREYLTTHWKLDMSPEADLAFDKRLFQRTKTPDRYARLIEVKRAEALEQQFASLFYNSV